VGCPRRSAVEAFGVGGLYEHSNNNCMTSMEIFGPGPSIADGDGADEGGLSGGWQTIYYIFLRPHITRVCDKGAGCYTVVACQRLQQVNKNTNVGVLG